MWTALYLYKGEIVGSYTDTHARMGLDTIILVAEREAWAYDEIKLIEITTTSGVP